MKSEKAQQIIRDHEWMDDEIGSRAVYTERIIEAIEVAEQEAEERMREKALIAFDYIGLEDGDDYDYYRNNFIQKLNEQ